MDRLYNVSVSPHVRKNRTTSTIMRDVVIALLPASIFGIWYFGLSALWIILVSVAACVAAEFIYEKLMKLPITIGDYSAAVTGLLLALNLSSTVPLWMPILGGVFAILVVKQLFGGIGQNFMNPALAARCFLLISFSSRMANFAVDSVSGATPLAAEKAGQTVSWVTSFIGTHPGCIGETSVIALLIGAAYLLVRRVITMRISGTYILSTAVFIFLINILIGNGTPDVNYMLTELFSGGLIIGAFFMANDYTTSPITLSGQVVYGVLIGFLTALLRIVGTASEGVSFAIIIGNMLTPLIEKITVPKPFGVTSKEGKRA